MTRTTGVAMLTLLVALGGCQTIRNARARIVRAPPRCQDETVPIYFQPGAAGLTPEGRRVIVEAATRARGCSVKSVSVVGLADAGGDEAANFELSRRRAASVSAAIVDAGLPPRELQLSAAGEGGAATADGAAPLRRRAEVTFHLGPPT